MIGRWDGIFAVVIAMLVLTGIGAEVAKSIDTVSMPWNHSSMKWPNPFENVTELKDKWQERFAHMFNFNETRMEKEWNKWQRKWQEKFNETSEKFKEKWKNATKKFQEMKEDHRFVGRLSYENGYCAGSFVRFLYDEGDIVDYTIVREVNITVFNFVYVSNFTEKAPPSVHGAVWRVKGNNAMIEVHDHPASLLKIKATADTVVTMVLSSNVSASLLGENITEISGGIEGKVIICGEGDFLHVGNGYVNVSLNKNATLVFLAHPEPEVSVKCTFQKTYEEKIHRAIGEGKICSVVTIGDENETDDVTFGDVNLSTNISKGKVRILIEGKGERKIIVIDVSDKIIDPSKNITVKLDNESISMVKDIDKLLNMTGDSAAYLAVAGENGIKVLVSIPSFSTHSVDIMEMQGSSEGTTPGFGFLIAIAAIVLYAVFIRKFQ